MSKKIILIIITLLFTGCFNNEYSNEKKLYNSYIKELENISLDSFDAFFPFDIDVSFYEFNDLDISYQVIIDNPVEELKNIKILAIHDLKTDDIYPTIGIFSKPLNLIPGVIDLDNHIIEGIILIGFINNYDDINDYNGNIRVLIEYEDKELNINKKYYLYQK